MRVLILGGSGMLGHKAFQVLSERHETFATFRGDGARRGAEWIYPVANRNHYLHGIDALSFESVERALATVEPEAVVNCIGIVKQRSEAADAVASISVNSLLPHRLARFCVERGIRLLHVSTDCVFSGLSGRYSEQSIPDPIDLYGRSKLLGEIDIPGCLTLRTSLVGRQIEFGGALLDWFATQRGRTVRGFTNAMFSGLSTTAMARLLDEILEKHRTLSGLYHVASEPISKFSLLESLRDCLAWHDTAVDPDPSFHCDRSLDGRRFEATTGWRAPAWERMIAELAADWPLYEEGRANP